MIFNTSIRKYATALVLCLLLFPFSRYISPLTTVGGHQIYLAYLPVSLMIAMVFIYGRVAIVPLIISSVVTFSFFLNFPFIALAAFIICLIFPIIICSMIVRYYLGPRWRYALTDKGMGIRILWLGFVAPVSIKLLMYFAGQYISFPANVAAYFGDNSHMFMVMDFQSLVASSLIFNFLFYYPLRMILNPHYARAFWRRCVMRDFIGPRRFYSFTWLLSLVVLLTVLCSPSSMLTISGYLVPVVFILFTLGIRHFGPRLMGLLWGLSAWFLLTFNRGFLYGVNTEFALSFILSVFISFSVCMLYMTMIFKKNEWMKRIYHSQALTDPLTQLPNLRALEQHVQCYPEGTLCCLRMSNLEFLSRHYGMMMRIHCKRIITSQIAPLMQQGEQVFQLPGSELLIFLRGQHTNARLEHIVDLLNCKKIKWHNTMLEIEYGAAYSVIDNNLVELHHTLGKLSYLSEQTSIATRVLSLNTQIDYVSDKTTERVLLLQKIKRVLNEEDPVVLYAQPIVDATGKGYYEILSRIVFENQIIAPDKFIPIIAEFNLSTRFDMLVVKKLVNFLYLHPNDMQQPHFSVNLMPLTLMQKDIAQKIVSLFTQYQVPTSSVIIEVTEEQAFSDSETSMQNITLLRDNGFKIAIDDFGTGYANYERLKRLQADIIKIDGCFIKDITSDSLDPLIVKSICDMARAKQLNVVAEYVETEEQRALLHELGVQFLQGYLIGKPEPLTAVHALRS
ncbi:sensor domain-containing phosphodiesterase [Buttiauxella sp. B2]|uniref:sensor domain-containing phosphodiesterase n=1 Tax=Buttiauxella sp. B2 TaxID=2587812 RepID=UPI00111EDB25|nr:EAL domain-containing protein [Buttiauxella sp. B2]TNV20244.1 sensor domain-containing phosphodiesterase [Buttiauxella sp. B2]